MTRAIVQRFEARSAHTTRSTLQEIHQNELGEVVWVCEVRLAIGHRRHLLNEVDKVMIARQHESVNHYVRLPACLDFLKSFGHDERIITHRVLVEQPLIAR